MKQLDEIIRDGLLRDVHFIYIYGDNPDTDRREKDEWDYMDDVEMREKEASLIEEFLEYAVKKDSRMIWSKVKNQFNSGTVDKLASKIAG